MDDVGLLYVSNDVWSDCQNAIVLNEFLDKRWSKVRKFLILVSLCLCYVRANTKTNLHRRLLPLTLSIVSTAKYRP